MKYVQIILLWITALATTVLIGCNKNTVIPTETVTGIVTLDGQPLEGVSITFVPKSAGTSAYARSGTGGYYTLQTLQGAPGKGTTVGEYAVVVTKSEAVPSGETKKDSYGGEVLEMTSKALLPEIYSSSDTTPLTFQVNTGTNKYDIVLQSKP
jgi:hypothetical protein